MVEMTPEHLETQVDIELQEDKADMEGEDSEEYIMDFGVKLVTKLAKDGRGAEEDSKVPVDPLSLVSLLSQGFEESL